MKVFLPLALLVAAAALAGCSNVQQDTLRAIYHDDLDASGDVPIVHGAHLEAQGADGHWADTAAIQVQPAAITGPPMSAPAPNGGGGDVTRLAGMNATLSVRIKEAARLGGLTAHWFVHDRGAAPSDLAQAQATLPGDGTFSAHLAMAGPFAITVVLTSSSVDPVPQARIGPLLGSLQATYTATGQVEPSSPPNPGAGPPPPGTPREQMADRYQVGARPGSNITAKTSYAPAGNAQGTDVDLGLYDPVGKPVLCSSSGGGQVPVVGGGNPVPDPAQASESLAAQAAVGGTWNVDVGAQQDGCPLTTGTTGSFFYANSGPVPYKLELTVG